MKSISGALKRHFKSELTNLATLWKIVRKDGLVLGFTDHDRDIVYDEVVYQSSGGYTPTAVDTQTGLNVDNLNVQSVLDHSSITEEDIRAGKYDNATVEILKINWRYPSDGVMYQRKGTMGELTSGRLSFEAELRGMTQPLTQKIGRVYTAGCQANLGDTKCKKDLTSFTFVGTVATVLDNRRFESDLTNANDYFNGGILLWLTGKNEGIRVEVKTFLNAAGRFDLYNAMTYNVAAGDTFSVYRGCNKDINTCRDVFSNTVNFRGFPHIPGYDQLFKKAG